MKTIRVTCEPTIYLPYTELHVFQGNLKELSRQDYEKMRDEIIRGGFYEGFSIWKNEDVWWILNGTQRYHVIKTMVEVEGYSVPDFPCNPIIAENRYDASLKCLSLASSYGKPTEEGLHQYLVEHGLEFKAAEKVIVFPAINNEHFEANFYKDVTPPADEEGSPGDAQEDAVPTIEKKLYVRRGDIFLLGAHRLLCGDATNKTDVENLMAGDRAQLVFEDPPYNVGGHEAMKSYSDLRPQSFGALKDAEWDKNFDIRPHLYLLPELMHENCSVYVCTSHHLAGHIWEWMAKEMDYHGWCVWAKSNPMPSIHKRHWTWNSELICYATRGKHVFNFPEQGHALSVWQLAKSVSNDLHPTQKPVHVPEHAILHSSNSGEIVVDLFAGSGSTMIACEKNGRACRTMEIDQYYASVAIQRWCDYTGLEAHRLEPDGTETPWSEIKAQP